jgi:hypothetical protein
MSKTKQTSKRDEKFLDRLEFERANEVGADYPLSPLERQKWWLDKSVQAHFNEAADMLAQHDKRNGALLTNNPPTTKRCRPVPIPPEFPGVALTYDELDLLDEEELDRNAEGYTYINLDDRSQSFRESGYDLGRTVLLIKSPKTKPYALYLTELSGDSFDLTITAGRTKSNQPKAFLSACAEGGEMCYYELGEFCLLAVTDETLDGTLGIFTYFNKKNEVLYSDFVTAAPQFKDAKLIGKPSQQSPVLPLIPDKQAQKLILKSFDELVARYASAVEARKQSHGKALKEHIEPMSVLSVDNQTRTQDELLALCRIIRSRGRLGTSHYTEINLRNLGQIAHGHNYTDIYNMELSITPVGDKVHNYSLCRRNELPAVIIAGHTGSELLAFVVFNINDVTERIIELETFSLLNVHYQNPETHGGLFTMFSKTPSMLSVEMCETYPSGKLRLLDK